MIKGHAGTVGSTSSGTGVDLHRHFFLVRPLVSDRTFVDRVDSPSTAKSAIPAVRLEPVVVARWSLQKRLPKCLASRMTKLPCSLAASVSRPYKARLGSSFRRGADKQRLVGQRFLGETTPMDIVNATLDTASRPMSRLNSSAYGTSLQRHSRCSAGIAATRGWRRDRLDLRWGCADLLNTFYQAKNAELLAGQLGTTYFVPSLVVPLLLITHALAFRILLQHQRGFAMPESWRPGEVTGKGYQVEGPHRCNTSAEPHSVGAAIGLMA